MQRLEVSGAVRPLYGSLGVKGLKKDGENVLGRTCRLLDMDEGLLENTMVNLLAPELFFFNLAHPVYKMCIIQKPNTLEL